MKVLLATDGSPYSERAVKEISERKFPENTEVRIISVYETASLPQKMEPMGTLREYHAEMDKKAREYAESVAENAAGLLREKDPALSVTTAVIAGSPKRAILNEAEEYGANLIVMGSHGYGAVKSFLLGSVSHGVVLHATCSVEIIR
ncbi:MAG: universal stress protein [Bacteroidota bacterium]